MHNLMLRISCGLALLVSALPAWSQPSELWTPVSRSELAAAAANGAERWVEPPRSEAFELDADALAMLLATTPLEGAVPPANSPTVLTVPRPDGSVERFGMVRTRIMEAGLEQWFVDQGYPMRTYAGVSLDHPGNLVFADFGGPQGFHAMVRSIAGDGYFIDPYWRGESGTYASYFRHDLLTNPGAVCHLKTTTESAPAGSVRLANGTQLRTYRLAVAGQGEYTTFHGGTVVAGQAAIVTAINRVTGVYEVDLSIRLTLVANNNLLVYTNAATDPYTNNDSSGTTLTENQANIDAVIGDANYDVGHVFNTGGGGLAGLGVVGITGQKALGATGLFSPIGDPFYIDFVSHELGHQFAGNHSFNGDSGNCAGGNRNGSTAYEPGSGSTIQAYAGICGNDNLQSNSDPYFHRVSMNEMLSFVDTVIPAVGTRTATGNTLPTVNAGSDFTIPAQTPFELTGSGSDGDGDPVTYVWEQWDLGPQQDVNAGDNGSSPLFRSWTPTTSPVRVFPRLSDLLNNTTVIGETLPTTTRSLNFELTIRDNRLNGGGSDNDAMLVSVVDTGAPFAVTFPNGGESICGMQTVTWNVAGTTAAPISAANVDILLSTDGGLTYPQTLAAATPNDGSEQVTITCDQGSTLRVRVQGTGNIFFDISNSDFGTPVPVGLKSFTID